MLRSRYASRGRTGLAALLLLVGVIALVVPLALQGFPPPPHASPIAPTHPRGGIGVPNVSWASATQAPPRRLPSTAPTPLWTNLTASVGSTPYSATGQQETYDAAARAILLVEAIPSGTGAVEGTFTFDGSIWVNLTSALTVAPPPLVGPALGYDSRDGYAVLYGGDRVGPTGAHLASDDTWAFRGGVWTNLTNASAPPPSDAGGGAMTWDGADGYLLLYLNCSSGCGQPETWSYVGGNWSKITTTSVPGARDGAAMVYDALDGYVVFFGGSGPGDRDAQDTWEYRLDAWSNRSSIAGGAPEGGVPAGMGFDVSATSVFLVEGHRVACGTVGCVPSPVEGTWSYASNSWRNLTSNLSVAPPRGGTAFAYDPLLHSSVLMGIPGAPGAGETWTFQEQLPPLAATPPTVAPAEVDVGTSVLFSTTASGGSGIYGYAWSGLPPGCASQNMSSVPCTPGAPGNFSVLVNVTDSAGHLVQAGPLPLTVHPRPSIASLRASRYQDTVGAAISWTAIVSGGAGSGTFTWSGLPTPCQGSSTNVEVCVPDAAGSFSVHVNFTDLAGDHAGASLPLTVNPPPAIASFTAQPSPNASVGAPLTLVLRATGGTGALSFNYSGLPPGCSSQNTSSLGCTPQQAGTFWVHATAKDQDGREVNATLPLVLSGVPGSSAGPFGPYGGVVYAMLAVGVLVVVLSTLILYLRRRSSRLPPTPPSPEAAGVPASEGLPPLGQVDEAPPVASTMPPGEEEHADATQKPSPRRPAVVRPPPSAEGPVGAPDSMCVICGGQGQIDETTGKYYCPRCDRRY